MQFSDVVKSITREDIVPKVYDTILAGNVSLLRHLGNAQPWGSGFRKDVIIKYTKSTNGGLVGLGGTLDTTRQNTRVKLSFDPKRRHKSIVMDDIEVTLNQGDQRVLELLATEMSSVGQDLLDDAGNDFYQGSGSGENFDSILNAADDASNYPTYGGQSRSTYTSIKGYLSTAVGALALADLSTAHSATKLGSDKPTLMSTDTTGWTAYEGLLQPTVKAGYQTNGYPQVTRMGDMSSQAALRGDIGFDAIWYRGTPVVEDEKCTSGYMFFENERYFKFHGIDLAGYEKININDDQVDGPQAAPIPRGFNYSGLLRPSNQPAEVGHLYIVGNYISYDPRRTGSLQGITG